MTQESITKRRAQLRKEIAACNANMKALFHEVERLYAENERFLESAKAKGYDDLVVRLEEQKERMRKQMIRIARNLGGNQDRKE